VVRACAIAAAHGGRFTFQRLLMQQGLTELVGDKGSLSRLEKIMAHLPEVEAWRFTLTEREKIDWVSPITRLKQDKEEAVREIADLEERLAAADAGSLFDLKRDSAKDIAHVIFSTISAGKAIEIAKQLTKLANAVQAGNQRRRRSEEKTSRIGEVMP
jgi:glutathione S-transferase